MIDGILSAGAIWTKEDFDQDYWNKLWRWYDQGGAEHVAAYLAALDLSGFDAKAPPPKTRGLLGHRQRQSCAGGCRTCRRAR